ncbi:super-infection exclusion protein B [Anthocerotibacter panamensis]|uniref:super-infection exclusion protein B n=1 Tax=Anthocerotibacter panamensis TaxID=2857077 RepID=UPI001C4024A0|nr:super-infection exclusion protein B [Anthocerotibacter panamensis]
MPQTLPTRVSALSPKVLPVLAQRPVRLLSAMPSRFFKPRILLSLGFLGLLVLFLPQAIALQFGILPLHKGLGRSWVGGMTLACFTFWLVQTGEVLARQGHFAYARWRQVSATRHAVLEAIHGLSSEERLILGYCLWRHQRTVFLDPSDPAALVLTHKGLLVRAEGTGGGLMWPFTVPYFVWRYLQRPGREFLPPSRREHPQTQRVFEEFERSLSFASLEDIFV